jgi:type III secretory pathway component EscU
MTSQDDIDPHKRTVDDSVGAGVGAGIATVIASIFAVLLSIPTIVAYRPIVGGVVGLATQEYLRYRRLKMPAKK